jgi:hypothetical protein
MRPHQEFIFKNYHLDEQSRELRLVYGFDDQLEFTEVYKFDFPFVEFNAEQLDRALQNLFFMAGVSYYKAYLPARISYQAGQLDEQSATFFSKTYERGLGEFFYVNKLDPRTPVTFTATTQEQAVHDSPIEDGLLIGLGGGKDSLVTLELLRNQPRVATWSLGHKAQLQPLVDRTEVPHLSVDRQWDTSLLEHNAKGALNGHVPISAIFACVGTVVGILAGYNKAVVSNEHSANEPTLLYQDVAINHQYSKSIEFEQDYQALLQHCFGASLQYFSFLRPLSELRIAELFATTGFAKYHDVFSSCNRAFVHSSNSLTWCGECPKCAFVFLALSPFVERKKLEQLWGGKNLLWDPELETTYRQLLGIEGDKPLECVGEIKESRAAMRLEQQLYPELAKYQFELPDDYDYRELAPHSMPPAYYDILLSHLAN